MKNKILLLFFFYLISNECATQPIKAYGGYIQSRCLSCFQTSTVFYYEFEVSVFFEKNSKVPDTLYLSSGLNKTYLGINQQASKTCSNSIKVKYLIPSILYGMEGIFNVVAQFEKDKVKFINDTLDFYLYNTLQIGSLDFGFENISTSFKDNPILEIEKGRAINFNLTNSNLDQDSVVYKNLKAIFEYSTPKLNNAKLNRFTGDLFYPNNLDTGWFYFRYDANDYLRRYRSLHSTSRYFFSIHIVNKKMPYFNHFDVAKIDEYGIYNIYASPNDKTVNYQSDFINPKGLGNYSIDIPTTKPFNKPPTVKTTQINDTLLHINIDINLDSGYYPVYRDLPNSFSIIVTTTDSTGNCTQDLTSFYLTNNPTNSIDELTTKNKINIFPNPATTKLTVNSETALKEIFIYDFVGKLVKQVALVNTKTKETEIAIDELNQGIYIIQVIDVFDAKSASKFIKK